ncbi:MAG: aminotransferase class I/II-fold pyridoxal phosphate-dependent enzyme [Thermoguttaceae bacterium]
MMFGQTDSDSRLQTFFAAAPPQRSTATTTAARESIEHSLSLDGPPDAYIRVGGRAFQYHAGSGYFGLAANAEVLAAACEATLRYGVGTATTRAALTSPPVFEVERRIATISHTSRAFYTASGYMANQILVDVLVGTFDRVFIDESAHASLYDAIRTTRGPHLRATTFRHNSAADLEEKLRDVLRPSERPLVLTDGVFSIFGDIAPIRDYEQVLSNYGDASLVVDDAHGFGVLGRSGCGTLEHFDFDLTTVNRTVEDDGDMFCASVAESPVRMYWTTTMSKGVGGYGGVIAGTERFIERLTERSRVFAGASAPPTPIAAATAKSLAILFDDDSLRGRLYSNARLLKDGLRNIGIETNCCPLPMVSLVVGSALNMRRLQKELSQRGILIAYLPRHPGLGSEGALRIAVFATHTPEMIEHLIDTLAAVL